MAKRSEKTVISFHHHLEKKKTFREDFFLLTKRSFKFSGKWPFWPYLDSNKTGDRWYKVMNYKELRKNRHILYHLHLEKKKTFREDFFLLRNRSFHFSGKFVIFSESPLISDCKEIVQRRELQKTKKEETYLISPTSREIEDF